jgi:signal transduction histidine kinase
VAHATADATADSVRSTMLLKSGAAPWVEVGSRLRAPRGGSVEVLGEGDRLLAASGVPADRRTDLRRTERTLANDPECLRCHGDDGPVLGRVVVHQSTETADRLVGRTRLGVAIAGLAALVLGVLVTRLILRRHLGRPLATLVEGARAIGAGEVGRHIELEDETELSELANVLDESSHRLAETLELVERQRDDFERLYRFTDQVSRAVQPRERRRRAVELATRFLGAECTLVRGSLSEDGAVSRGTVTLRGEDGYEDHPFRIETDRVEGLPTYLADFVRRWIRGEFDREEAVRERWVIGHPLRVRDRSVGLLLLPAPTGEEGEDTPPPEPGLVRALCGNIAVALEFSDLQNELVSRERLAAIGETVAGLAHCLKNILNGLRAGQYVVDRAVDQGNPEKLATGWRVAKAGIQQVERLTQDMLYYVKERPPQREPVDPNAIVDEVVTLLFEAGEEKGVNVHAEPADDLGEIALDRLAIFRALLNLATNAIDACLESEEGESVVLRTRREGDDLILEVEDDGVGMSEEVQAQLFRRFFSTKAGRGTGLGLPVVRKIAEEHGGRVEMASTPGEGTTFRLRLPVG